MFPDGDQPSGPNSWTQYHASTTDTFHQPPPPSPAGASNTSEMFYSNSGQVGNPSMAVGDEPSPLPAISRSSPALTRQWHRSRRSLSGPEAGAEEESETDAQESKLGEGDRNGTHKEEQRWLGPSLFHRTWTLPLPGFTCMRTAAATTIFNNAEDDGGESSPRRGRALTRDRERERRLARLSSDDDDDDEYGSGGDGPRAVGDQELPRRRTGWYLTQLLGLVGRVRRDREGRSAYVDPGSPPDEAWGAGDLEPLPAYDDPYLRADHPFWRGARPPPGVFSREYKWDPPPLPRDGGPALR